MTGPLSDPAARLDELLRLPAENEVVEFKEAKRTYDFRKLGKYFSALSNEANLRGRCSGWFVFGVRNDRTVCGSAFRPNRPNLDSLKEEIANKTTARISFVEIYEIDHNDGRVVLLHIPAAPRGIPVGFEGHFYGRDGEAIGALNPEEYDRIRAQARLPVGTDPRSGHFHRQNPGPQLCEAPSTKPGFVVGGHAAAGPGSERTANRRGRCQGLKRTKTD